MKKQTFVAFKNYIEENIGIKIPDTKKIMVESRLLRRLKALEYSNYEEYAEYFFSEKGQLLEVPRFVECITTNKTDFFRENDHFEYLTNKALPDILKKADPHLFRLWSGASSTGEEAYTMAMVVSEFLEGYRGRTFKILATDISERVLNTGREAIYTKIDSAPIPSVMKKKYCLQSKDLANPTIRIKKNLREKVLFRPINLTATTYNITNQYHVIFLRNVMIYFDKETQKKILNNLYLHLHKNGYLFLGHSENLPDSSVPFKRVGPSIYVKKDGYE